MYSVLQFSQAFLDFILLQTFAKIKILRYKLLRAREIFKIFMGILTIFLYFYEWLQKYDFVGKNFR